ncbi:5-oxoprolinase subunit B family protein [Oceanicola sp. S124]|uniref:5-oxoprolinase subunit B family protein n=1 Tax=Oceanicola sp. S124 TaxID=1042378 RepID=UPI0002557D44|nr:carboxyltransferase domain-containing protein [Oceanicola sp. S124]
MTKEEAASAPHPGLHPLGMDGFLARFGTEFSLEANRAAQAFAREASALEGVEEVLPALASTLVRFDSTGDAAAGRRGALQDRLTDLLQSRDWLALPAEAAARRWTLPVSFDGEDAPGLAEAAAEAGLSEADAVAQILDAAPRVLAIGFAPGQPYIGLLPEAWDFPRRTELRDVPAGALVAAIRQLVLFANASPTGWLQIGRTAFAPFQPGAEQPMPLRQGDEIRLARISRQERQSLSGTPMGGARLEVLR